MSEPTDHLDRARERALTVAGKGRHGPGSLAPATRRGYGWWQRKFRQWARERGISLPIPCTPETLADWCADLLADGYASSTVRKEARPAVMAMHRQAGHPVPDGVPSWYVLRAHDLTAPAPPKDRPMIGRAALLAVAAVVDTDRAAGVRDLAIVTLLWWGMLRPADLAALDVNSVRVVGEHLEVTLPGGGVARVRGEEDAGPDCPVSAVQAWLSCLAAAGGTSGPLLRSIDKSGNIAGCAPRAGWVTADGRLTVRGVAKVWSRLTAAAGLPAVPVGVLRLDAQRDRIAAGDSITRVMASARLSMRSGSVLARLAQAQQQREEQG